MTLNNFKEAWINFFVPQKAPGLLMEEIIQQRNRIQKLQEEYSEMQKWNIQYAKTLGILTDSMNALVWKKDENHKYILANPFHCSHFFGIDATKECLFYIQGKSDQELIQEVYTSKGIKNTFGEIAFASDQYVKTFGKLSHFLEGAFIDNERCLLYVIKTPLYKDNIFIGTVGIGWDFSNRFDFWNDILHSLLYEKKALEIYNKEDTFVYSFEPDGTQCELFAHFCPKSYIEIMKGDKCNGQCEVCHNQLG